MGLVVIVSCKSKKLIELETTNREINYIPYFLKVYEADSLYIVKEYEKAYRILGGLFKEYKPLNIEQYKEYETYISCAYVLNMKINFKDSILKSIELYGSNSRYFKYDSLMNETFKNVKFASDDILRSTKAYRSTLNFRLRDSIQVMCRMDQEVRQKELIDYRNMSKVDSLNQIKLENIFNKYGFPHEKLIGEFYIDSTDINLGAIFLHTEKKFRLNFLLPNILNFVKKGLAYPENYTQSYDRYLEDSSGKQLYGSYNLKRLKQTIEFIDKKNLDSIRRSVGLPSKIYKRWRLKKKYGIDADN